MTYGANTANKFIQLPNQTLWTYNLWDTYTTARLMVAVRQEMRDLKAFPSQWDYFERWIIPLKQAVRNMQRRGILVDKQARSAYGKSLNRELGEVDSHIAQVAGNSEFNPNSDHQVRALLFKKLGLKPAGKTDTGQPSVNQTNLFRVLRDLRKKDEPYRELLENLLHRSRLQTIKERYLGFDTGHDGRLRARVKMTGTVTFRYAYADPALQQFPNETRRFFCARPGHLLLSLDYSQLEARILAILSEDPISLAAFAEGRDIHAQNALDLFAYDSTQWESLRDEARKAARNSAKAFLYRISYGGEGAVDKTKIYCPCPRCVEKTPPTLDLKPAQILEAERRWFQAHHAVRRWQEELLQAIRRNHYYDSPFGLRRWISAGWTNKLAREMKNLPMQMNAALRMNQAQVELDRLEAPILLQNHDAFVFEIPDSPGAAVDQRIADYRGVMEQPVPELSVNGEPAVFPTDAELGENWASHDPETNPNGLAKC